MGEIIIKSFLFLNCFTFDQYHSTAWFLLFYLAEAAASTSWPWMLPTNPDFMLSDLTFVGVSPVAAAISSRGALIGQRVKENK